MWKKTCHGCNINIFSTNYTASVVIRLIHGLLDGVIPIAKTIVSEISNERNIALGTSSIFVGPILCGYLSDPTRIPFLVDHFPIFEKQPFLFPFLISAVLLVISIILYLILSVETLTEEERAHTQKLRDGLKKGFSAILRKSRSKLDSKEQLLITFNEQSSPRHLFKQKDFLLTMILFAVISFIQMGADTILLVALASPVRIGGLNLSNDIVSLVMGIASPFQLFLMLLSPVLSQLFPYKSQFGWEIFLFSLLIFIAPFILKLGNADPMLVTGILMAYLALLTVIRALWMNTGIVLFANLSYKEVRGTIMGLGQMIGGVCRFLGPLIVPVVYSWSCRPHKWIDSGFCFYILGICGMLCSALAIWISEETNTTKGSLKK
ncbi:uncharacterized protein [Blastocystis hominis]|uniref:Major facilitator superfamily (MFS) profile domain-containing protein n=1 Tax=Blastocystis hominis TaxID=12968 RepID=D8M5B7_BLAHO|nr:uncharacterized protein [Blastocystis hominis]CBK23256.2 unnamed protein product [Blastocystis hominis]|eukprot:XP_012897304.1 uncharacterized protein [Blastocystis hominis]